MTAADRERTGDAFRHGAPEQFSRLRELLIRSDYAEALLCERAGVPSIHYFPVGAEREVLRDVVDAQSLFVALFIDGAVIESRVAHAVLAPADFETVEALGLLRTVPSDSASCTATVALYPVEELFVASDRADHPAERA